MLKQLGPAAALTAALALLSPCGCDCDSASPPPTAGASGPHAVLFELDGAVPQFADPAGFPPATGNDQQRLEKLLARAQADVQVQEVVVHFGAPELGWARAGEIADAISRVAAAGKPVTCHLEAADNLTYWMAARGCPRLLVAPAGGVDLIGLSLEAVFLKELLDSIGVSADMLHIGRYKDAAEALTRNDMSPEARAANQSLLDDLHRIFVTGIATGRRLEPAAIDQLIDGGPYGAEQAKLAGLVDDVTTLGAYLDTLREKHAGGVVDDYGKEPAKPLSIGELLKLLGGDPALEVGPTNPRIALVPAIGPVVSGGSDELLGGMELIRDNKLVKALSDAARDSTIRAVVLRIDSPGGSALASDNIWRAVRDLAAVKPVVASMGDVAASGGYYIAAAATEVYASPGTLTGSIGVVGGKIVLGDALTKIGMHTETLQKGRRATLVSPFKPFSEDERSAVQQLMQQTYDLFVDRVVEGRALDRQHVLEVAEGRVWTGAQALGAKLVTGEGTLHDAIERARTLGSLPGGPVEVHPKPKSFMELISEAMGQPQVASVPLSVARSLPAGRRALALASLLRRQRVLAFAPVVLEVR